MVAHLRSIAEDQGVQYEDEALHLIASKADGALRDALSLFDQMVSFTSKHLSYKAVAENLNVLDHSYYSRVLKAINTGSISDAMLIYHEILEQGFDSLLFMIGMAEHLRNVLVAMDGATVKLLDCPDNVQQEYLDQARSTSAIDIIAYLDILQKSEVEYRASKNKRLLTENNLDAAMLTRRWNQCSGLDRKKKVRAN